MDQTHNEEPRPGDPVELFEERWREWGRRPPTTAPDDAARRVAQQVAKGRARRPLRWIVAAAAAAAVVIVGVGLIREERPGAVLVSSSEVGNRPLEQGVVLMWIDEQTPLYMTFQDPGSAAPHGGGS